MRRLDEADIGAGFQIGVDGGRSPVV